MRDSELRGVRIRHCNALGLSVQWGEVALDSVNKVNLCYTENGSIHIQK